MFRLTPNKQVTLRRTLMHAMTGVFVIATVLYGVFAIYTGTANAATNNTVNFQARLEGAGGNIAADGFYNVEFKLYSVTTGGTALWTESYLDVDGSAGTTADDFRVKVVNGYLSVPLGSRTAFPGTINWDQDLYLTMNIGGTTITATPAYDGEMSPRLKLTGVPYAFRAGQLAQFNAATGFTSSLSLMQPTVGNQTFQVADQAAAGTYTLCVQGAANSAGGCAANTGGAGYIQNGTGLQTSSNFNIQAATSGGTGTIGGIIRGAAGGQTVDLLQLQSSAGIVTAQFSPTGQALFTALTDTTTAFNVKSSLSNNVLTVDTLNGRVGINLSGNNTPVLSGVGQGLEVNGALRLSGGSSSSKTDQFTTPVGSVVGTKINIPVYDPGAFGQIIAMGIPSTSAATSRVISLFDARTAAHQPTIGVFSPNEANLVGFSWEGSNDDAYLKTTGGNLVLRSGTTDLLAALTNGEVFAQTYRSDNFDVRSAANLQLGATYATGINLNQSTTLAAGKSITLVGGITALRPAVPAEGMLFYDTTTKQLLVYANGKWQADRSSSTVVVGTSAVGGTSGATASKAPDGADFVNTSTTSAQTVINSAIAALPATGGSVYLMEGTYIVDGSISIPNNTALIGAGSGTVIKFKNSVGAGTFTGITNTDQINGQRIAIRNLRLDGNKANNATGSPTMHGIYLNSMGSISTVDGAKISGVTSSQFLNDGIALDDSSHYNSITNSHVQFNSSAGISIASNSTNNTLTGNTSANNSDGYNIVNSSKNVLSGNTSGANLGGIWLSGATNNVITGNSIKDDSLAGIDLDTGSNNNLISGNKIDDSGGANNNNGIQLLTADSNTIIGNNITDTSCTTTCYAINISNAGSDTNYLADNRFSDTDAAATATIQDLGTGTVFANQIDSSGNLRNTTSGSLVSRLQSGSSADLFQAQDSSGNALFKIGSTGTLTVGRSNGAAGTTGTIVVANAANNNTVTIASGTTTSSYQLNLPPSLGITGDCLKIDSVASATGSLGFGSCGAGGGTLQSAYDSSSPASILLANAKDFTITSADTATDSNILFNLQCTVSCGTNGRFAVQNAGIDVLQVNPDGSIRIGTATNNVTFAASTFKPTSSGTARQTKTVKLAPEYAGAVLTGTSTAGTMTSDFCSGTSRKSINATLCGATEEHNYYQWTATASGEVYDVYVNYRMPSDFVNFSSSSSITMSGWRTNTTVNSVKLSLYKADGTECGTANGTEIAGNAAWASTALGGDETACTIAADEDVILRVRMTADTGGFVRAGAVNFSYLAKF